MNTQQKNDKQVKVALPARYMPGIAVKTTVKAGDNDCGTDCRLELRDNIRYHPEYAASRYESCIAACPSEE